MKVDLSVENVTKHLAALLMGNSIIEWIIALAVLVLTIFITIGLRWFIINRLDALTRSVNITFVSATTTALRKTSVIILFFPLILFSSGWLDLPDGLSRSLNILATIAFFLQLGIWLTALTTALIQHSRQQALAKNASAATSLSAVSFVSRLLIWSVIILLTLDNIGIDVTALVAGLGVGGVAVALAIQNILGDLFASLSIIIDKPFEIGDFIIVNEYLGTVENIGLKTTRIRSLGGEQIIFSNSDLLSSRVRNYKRMQERRVVFSFGVLYQTTPDQLEDIPGIVRQAIEAQNVTRFDRAHFFKFGDSSLDFEVVYYINSADYNTYMNTQQAINLTLMREFSKRNIEFAYPTRSLYVEAPVPVRIEPGQQLNQQPSPAEEEPA